MDVFSWSVPFLAEKVLSMLYTIVKKGCDDDDQEVDIQKVLGGGQAATGKIVKLIVIRGVKIE